ncbi:hypothetical protein NDU88_002165 [Pleurodeles waltl]|uniref:Uncharacterized protein n=1 Tax=Pleurodeles waltl TaxID=8319 RepID=A0AAV7RB41_PLEWA|nr:hypothetical protein NDU88_002165 [Pleurodeles waltl]
MLSGCNSPSAVLLQLTLCLLHRAPSWPAAPMPSYPHVADQKMLSCCSSPDAVLLNIAPGWPAAPHRKLACFTYAVLLHPTRCSHEEHHPTRCCPAAPHLMLSRCTSPDAIPLHLTQCYPAAPCPMLSRCTLPDAVPLHLARCCPSAPCPMLSHCTLPAAVPLPLARSCPATARQLLSRSTLPGAVPLHLARSCRTTAHPLLSRSTSPDSVCYTLHTADLVHFTMCSMLNTILHSDNVNNPICPMAQCYVMAGVCAFVFNFVGLCTWVSAYQRYFVKIAISGCTGLCACAE